MWIGITAALLASVFFGTVFVPIKRVAAGDGFTSQLFMCIGAFLASALVNGLLHFPPVHGFAMIGGVLWCTANAFAIQIINRLGMALAILVWNTTSCLTGWATSRYGFSGLPKAVPASGVLNYMGIIILISGGIMYLFVKNNTRKEATDVEKMNEKECSINEAREKNIEISSTERSLSFVCSMISGLFYGTMWLPINYMKNHPKAFPEAPANSTMYLFSFYCGVLATSVLIFIIYCLARRNKPWMNPEAAVPSMLGGAILSFGMSAFVVAIDNLDQAIAYPICAMLPGLVTSSWSILYFREITGRRNLTRLAVAYGLTLIGVTLVTVSKDIAFL